jgi:hypothetical protein
MGDRIFVRDGGKLSAQEPHPFRHGLDGVRLEQALQKLISENPALLPSSEIDPHSEDSLRFALLGTELSIAGGSLDILLVDQKGVLTLVETKLTENPESRRKVIGQILDYAANAREAWNSGQLRAKAIEYWRKQGQEPVDIALSQAFLDPAFDAELFWSTVEDNLKEGRLRLLIAADELRPEAHRVLEYLNQITDDKISILGLEVRCYGEESRLIIVPRLIGQTQEIIDRKSSERSVVWVPEVLRQRYQSWPDPELGSRLLALLDWALDKVIFLEASRREPGFSLKDLKGNRIAAFQQAGWAYFYFGAYPFNRPEDREHLVQALNETTFFHLPLTDLSKIQEGRNSNKTIAQLSPEQFAHFQQIMEEFCLTDPGGPKTDE